MIGLRTVKWATLLAVLWTLATPPRTYAQKDGGDDEPLTKEEFARFLQEYRQFKAEYTQIRDENKRLKNELATVKNDLAVLKEQGRRIEIEQAMSQERGALLKTLKDDSRRYFEPLLPGFNNLLITGFASTTFQDRRNVDSNFGAMLAPILLWKPTDKLFFESELHIMLGEDETHVDLGYAQISYLLNDYITLGGGKFLLPFGTFQERLHPAWINKLPTSPLATGLTGESGVGFQVRGGAPIGPTKINYAAYIINGPRFNETLASAGRLDFERNLDNNNNKSWGGRVGFLPIPELEVGISLLSGRVGDSGGLHSRVDTTMYGLDFSYAREFDAIKGRLDLRSEAVWVHTDDVIFTGPFNPFSFDNKSNGWYLQAAYRPTLVDIKLGDDIEVKNFEFVVRYDQLRRPGPDILGVDRDQVTFGIDYWILPNAVLKAAYVVDDAHGGRDGNGFFLQMGVGL